MSHPKAAKRHQVGPSFEAPRTGECNDTELNHERQGRKWRDFTLFEKLAFGASIAVPAGVAGGVVLDATSPSEAYAKQVCAGWSHPPYIDANCVVWVDDGTGTGGGGGGTTTPPPTTTPWVKKDDDRDGVLNGSDACQGTGAGEAVDANGCSANQRDDDFDGILGGVELFIGTDPNRADTDGDGKPDGAEVYLADGKTIKPQDQLDTDRDGKIDALESSIDLDKDGKSPETGDDDETDPCVPDATAPVCDADKDGLTNQQEAAKGTDPTKADTDADGVGDKLDVQNKVLTAGQKVDAKGVIIIVDPTTEATTPDSATPNTDGSTPSTESTVVAGVSTGESDNGSGNGVIYVLGALGALVVGGGGTLVWAKRRKQDEQPVQGAAPTRHIGGGTPRPGVVNRTRFGK